jgi:nucleotide-binding universal stress UspA family protein
MFKRLLVPLDCSPLAEQALGQAASIARGSGAAIDLALVHTAATVAGVRNAPWDTDEWKRENRYLEAISAELESGAGVTVGHSVLAGEVVTMLCQRAWDVSADLIVMTTHGRTGLSRMWLGSVAHGVLQNANVPVLMFRPEQGLRRTVPAEQSIRKILVPVDGSALSAAIVEPALALAKATGARMTLLRIVQPVPGVILDAGQPFAFPVALPDEPATEEVLADVTAHVTGVAEQLTTDEGVQVDAQAVVSVGVAQGILDYAVGHAIDLIALSTHGRGASRLLMGSVANKVAHASGVPTLLYKPVEISAEHAGGDGP